ncbi:MAG: CBS domain-containing protein [Nanoarchaeota archaeon]|nr:CBS domain-containing protein [Nanoarchaeota archaeon]
MKPEQDYKVEEFMNKDIVQVTPDTNVTRCAEVMAAEHVDSVLVTVDKKIAGIVTEKDLARKVVAKSLDAGEITVKDIMTVELVIIEPEKSLYDAMILLNKKKIKHLPVIKDNVVVGIITAMDILRVQPSYMEIMANPTNK